MTKGTTPKMKANDVIRIGRNRKRTASSVASRSERPCCCCCLANSTIRMAFLLASPTNTTKPIWVKIVTSIRASPMPTMEQSKHMGTTRITARGRPQLSYCAASTRKTNTTRQREDVDGRISRFELQERQLGPIGRRRSWQLFAREVLHQGDALARTRAGRRVAGDRGRGIHVVTHQRNGTAGIAHAQQGAQPDHLPPVVADLQLLDVGNAIPVARIGLHVHLPDPAELVEIVDVVGAEIDLQDVEDITDWYPEGHALRAVDVQVEPRRARAGAVEQACQAGRLVAPRYDLIADPAADLPSQDCHGPR